MAPAGSNQRGPIDTPIEAVADVGKRTCSIDGCDGAVVARGWCRKHYARWKRRGDPEAPTRFRTSCMVSECPERHSSRGYCRKHLHALNKYGDPLGFRKIQPTICEFDRCDESAKAGSRGYCPKHYKRLAKYGDPRGVCLTCTFCGCSFYPVNSLRKVCDECSVSSIRQHGLTAAELAERDGPTCSLCDEIVDMSVPYPDPQCGTVDHIIPWSLGGTHDPSNLALAHFSCNASKGNRVA